MRILVNVPADRFPDGPPELGKSVRLRVGDLALPAMVLRVHSAPNGMLRLAVWVLGLEVGPAPEWDGRPAHFAAVARPRKR